MKTATIQIIDRGIGIEIEVYQFGKKMHGLWAQRCDTIGDAIIFARQYFKNVGYTHIRRVGFAARHAL